MESALILYVRKKFYRTAIIAKNGLGNKYWDFKLFKPFDNTSIVIMSNHGLGYDCCGIIDQQGNCYSAIVSKRNCDAIQLWRRNNPVIVDGVLNANNVQQLYL